VTSAGFAVLAGAAAVAVAALPAGPARSATQVAVAAGAPLAVLAGVRLNRPASRQPWLLLAGALAVFLAAGGVSLVADWPDDLRLAGYPLLLAALAAVHRARRTGPSWAGLVDSAVVATTAALGYWVFVVDLDGANRRWTFVQLAFLAGDVLLIALVTRLVVDDVQSTSSVSSPPAAGSWSAPTSPSCSPPTCRRTGRRRGPTLPGCSPQLWPGPLRCTRRCAR
jgi:hypothetical protein